MSTLRLWEDIEPAPAGDPLAAPICGPRDRRLTPRLIVEAASQVAGGHITLDPCTEPDNPTGAEVFFTNGGLERSWIEATLHRVHPVAWVNPPFSQLLLWTEHAMGQPPPLSVLMFTLADMTTRYWQTLSTHTVARCELAFRPRSKDPETGRTLEIARSAVVWCRTDSLRVLKRFERAFAPLGPVLRLI